MISTTAIKPTQQAIVFTEKGGHRLTPSAREYFLFILDFVCTYYRKGGRDARTVVIPKAHHAFKLISGIGIFSKNPLPPLFLLKKPAGSTPAVVVMKDEHVIAKALNYLKGDTGKSIQRARDEAKPARHSDAVIMETIYHCLQKHRTVAAAAESKAQSKQQSAGTLPDAVPDAAPDAAPSSSHVQSVTQEDVLPNAAFSSLSLPHFLDPPASILENLTPSTPPRQSAVNTKHTSTNRKGTKSTRKSPSKPPAKRADIKCTPSKPPQRAQTEDPILAADDPEARERKITKINKETGEVEVLEFPTTRSQIAEFEERIHKLRVEHESDMKRKTSKAQVVKSCEKFSSGEAKTVPKSYLDKLNPLPTWRCENLEWVQQQEDDFKLVFRYMDELQDIYGLSADRLNWTWHTKDDDFMTFMASILSANTRDSKLFDVVYAMRKLEIFDLETLENYDLTKLQDLFLYVGYNNWTYGPAQIIGAAKRIKELGEIPKDAEKLYGFYGFGRKILMLVLQDVHGETQAGIICDTHLHAVFKTLGWADRNTSADNAARQVEAWLNSEYWYDVNPVFAGLRQLWEVTENREKMKEIAAKDERMMKLLPQLVRK